MSLYEKDATFFTSTQLRRMYPGLALPEGGDMSHLGYNIVQEPAPAEITLDDLKIAKLGEVKGAFENAVAAIKAGYPEDEIKTWDKQEAEARAWLANDTVETPMIDAMLARRPTLTKQALVERIIFKANIFAGIVGTLVGERQDLEDSIAVATPDTINSIVWRL